MKINGLSFWEILKSEGSGWYVSLTGENRQEKLEINAGKSNSALSLPLPIVLLNWFTNYCFFNSWILLEDRIIWL